MLTLILSFNRILIHHQGVTIDERGAFSNSRMIVADFEAFVRSLQAALKQAADKDLYTPPGKLFGNLFATQITLDIREELADGLSPLEYKVLQESLMAASGTRNIQSGQILYQGKKPFQAT